jgi:hypothetical protein
MQRFLESAQRLLRGYSPVLLKRFRGTITPTKKIEANEAIMNMLIVKLLVDDVDMKLIEKATGLDEKTIYKRFPMKLIKEARIKSKRSS